MTFVRRYYQYQITRYGVQNGANTANSQLGSNRQREIDNLPRSAENFDQTILEIVVKLYGGVQRAACCCYLLVIDEKIDGYICLY